MIHYMLLFSRQGKLRLQKWYVAYPDKVKKKITRELVTTILARKPKMCAFLEYKDLKVVYKRYASLYFCCTIEQSDNELICLEIIHRYVELLDRYFGSVCELDIIFNFEKAYFILDEFLLAGEVQETSKKQVLKAISAQDLLQDAIQKNFASYGKDGDRAAEEFIQQKKMTLARRFQLYERGYALVLKEDSRETYFDNANVQITFGEKRGKERSKSTESAITDKNSD
uniref:AP complex mu/sigma subunit domain-containing protein n=1 Tax=Meloidogyne javanica TaxID=6303 RepID=A0A915LRP4_MELJA